MIKTDLKNWILKNCEKGSIQLYIGSNKYIKTFYLYGDKVLHSRNIESLNIWLRNMMKIDTNKAIELGKKIDKNYINRKDYLETVGNIMYLMKDSFLMDNE